MGAWSMVMTKVLREAVRDRRSLGSSAFYAVWGPAVMAMAVMALARDRGPERSLTLPVAGAERAASLVSFLHEKRVTVVDAVGDLAQRVRSREHPIGLLIGDTYASRFLEQRPAPLTVLYDASWPESSSAAARLRALIAEYDRRLSDSRLIFRGVAPASANPIRLLERDLSTPAARAASVLGTLPIFLLVAAFVGGMGVAADEMAGERERRSLEFLLAHPVKRSAIVAGKWAAASTLAVATVALTIATASALLQHPRIQAMDLPIGLSVRDGATIFLVITPLALLVTAGQLLLALFARTYKEAQTQLSLLMFLPMIPGFLFAFGSIQVKPWMAWTPVLGQQVMLSAVLRGEPPAAGDMAALAGLTLMAAVAAAGVTAQLLSHESIVRRLD